MEIRSRQAFTLIELLVVISIIALLIGILLPALGAARVTARQMKDNTQLRGFQQGCFIYSQENDNLYPGLDTTGTRVWRDTQLPTEFPELYPSNTAAANGADVWVRFGILIDQNIIPAEYAISPGEIDPEVTPWDRTSDIAQENASYAMLRLGANNATNGLRESWRGEPDGQVPIASARNTASTAVLGRANAEQNPESVWTEAGSGEWLGGVVWNDGHVATEVDDTLDVTVIQNQRNFDDRLFTAVENTEADGGSNVRMNPTAAP